MHSRTVFCSSALIMRSLTDTPVCVFCPGEVGKAVPFSMSLSGEARKLISEVHVSLWRCMVAIVRLCFGGSGWCFSLYLGSRMCELGAFLAFSVTPMFTSTFNDRFSANAE